MMFILFRHAPYYIVFTIGLTSVVCGVWKLVGVQRLEGSLFYVPPGSCESTSLALCTNF